MTITIGPFGVVQIVFIVLKLCNLIDWSWGWVLAPTIISLVCTLFYKIFLEIKG